jgi:DNA-binding GntR family transcriptional regulator
LDTEAAGRYSADDVRRGLLEGLYSGRFVPGQKLIEADLVEAFDRPRSYVRDALLRLASEGVVEMVPFRGAYIRSFTPEEGRNIDLTFAALMALAAHQAAERIERGSKRARLVAALEDVKVFDPGEGTYEYALARERFYRVIIEISGNQEVARICPIMQGFLIRMQFRMPYREAEHQARYERFAAICDAIVAGEPVLAEKAVWRSVTELPHGEPLEPPSGHQWGRPDAR